MCDKVDREMVHYSVLYSSWNLCMVLLALYVPSTRYCEEKEKEILFCQTNSKHGTKYNYNSN